MHRQRQPRAARSRTAVATDLRSSYAAGRLPGQSRPKCQLRFTFCKLWLPWTTQAPTSTPENEWRPWPTNESTSRKQARCAWPCRPQRHSRCSRGGRAAIGRRVGPAVRASGRVGCRRRRRDLPRFTSGTPPLHGTRSPPPVHTHRHAVGMEWGEEPQGSHSWFTRPFGGRGRSPQTSPSRRAGTRPFTANRYKPIRGIPYGRSSSPTPPHSPPPPSIATFPPCFSTATWAKATGPGRRAPTPP